MKGEILALIDKEQQALETVRAELDNIQTRINVHQACTEQANAEQPELDRLTDNAEQWARLSDAFGSADGAKFRKIAQGYTFALLIEQANRHLRQLSPRYELSGIPGTLILQVIDHDMFDTHRHVTSLSGGETFVVSLALALGLAGWSSTSKGTLGTGTLFIDEGFGSLDRSSLDLVMCALSALQNGEGRKVGVISHTEQIRSQIYPQIAVSRLPAGGSAIQIR